MTVHARMESSRCSTVLQSAEVQTLTAVTNGERARIVLLASPDDPGGHAVDESASGRSGGFLLDDGQEDEYENRDTVPWPRAIHIVEHIVATGSPSDYGWRFDARYEA